ncbi:HAD-IA family hydrolase [Bradyrhizobium sp.]|jgi:HAD superfamily hydrolase (TIGR01509 family)|uniref:HAD-IA family hydrolase n=1 Tax=Bradyrhizobium sp. TaxID=376 RepID=UPI003C23BA82
MSDVLATSRLRLDRLKDLLIRSRALIFDVDGTLAETEEVHRQAFNAAFVKAKLDWCWGPAAYKDLLRVAGGKERIRAFDRLRGGSSGLSEAEIVELHRIKTTIYAELIASGGCPLRPGVEALLTSALRRGQRLAIATTTSRGNIDALLASALGNDWADSFAAIVAGDEVPNKKPAPDVYFKVLSRLNLAASECLGIEDSGIGLAAASCAGIPVLISRSGYFRDDDFSAALLAVDDLTEVTGL